MDWPSPEYEGGVDNNKDNNKGGNNDSNFGNNGQMPSEEKREEKEGLRVGGSGSRFTIQWLSFLGRRTQR